MSEKILSVKATDGGEVLCYNECIASNGVIDVYRAIDANTVIQYCKSKDYYNHIFGIVSKINSLPPEEYKFIKNSIHLPINSINDGDKFGFVLPYIPKKFYFEHGLFKGKERNIKWYYSAKLYNKFLDSEEKCSFVDSMEICKKIARIYKILHSIDLYQYDPGANYLVNIQSQNVYLVNLDNFCRKGEEYSFMPSPDFASPEYIANSNGVVKTSCPTVFSDRHALAVIIYMLLLKRHPLRGDKINSLDPAEDEKLAYGEKALYIENPYETSNKIITANIEEDTLPYGNPEIFPSDKCGPYLKELFDRAFIDGLHNPTLRPTAEEWESALTKSIDSFRIGKEGM